MAVLGYLEEVLPSEAEQVTDEDDEEQMGNLTCGETHFEIQKRECEESLA